MIPKKILHVVLVLAVCLSITVPAGATSLNQHSQYVESIDVSRAMIECITIDDLIAHSTIRYADSESMSGHYNGDQDILAVKIGNIVTAPDFGWTHTIEFDWTAKINSKGDFIFDNISDANSSVSPGLHLLYLDVESNETKDVYSFSSDRKTVTFSSSYKLQWRYYNESFTTNATADLTRTIEMQGLI